jgi:hypothetical protein
MKTQQLMSLFLSLLLTVIFCCTISQFALGVGYYDRIVGGGSSWTTTTLNTLDAVGVYSALCPDGAAGNPTSEVYFTSPITGSTGRIYDYGGWQENLGILNKSYVALSSDNGFVNTFFGLKQNGAIDYVTASGGWNAQALTGLSHAYYAFTGDGSDTTHELYGLWSGGLDYISTSGTWPGYTAITVSNSSYALLANDYAAHCIYAARTNGGLDCVTYNGGNIQNASGWTTVTLDTSVYQYASLAHDATTNYTLYGAVATGGINLIASSGAGWQPPVSVSGLTAAALARDGQIHGAVYAATYTGLYQLSCGSVNAAVRMNNKAYTSLECDASHTGSVFGYNANTSNSSISSLINCIISPDVYTTVTADTDLLQSITQRLGYLGSMGVNSIHLLPVTQQSQFANVGQTNASYWVHNPEILDSRRGTTVDFTNLVQTAHNNGIKVIVDAVPHGVEDGMDLRWMDTFDTHWSAGIIMSCHLIQDCPTWFKYNTTYGATYNDSWGDSTKHIIGTWCGGDFDWTNAALRNYWTTVWTDSWVGLYGLDGIRCDLEPYYAGYSEWGAVKTACADIGHPIILYSEGPNSREDAFDFEQVSIGTWPTFNMLENMSLTNLVHYGQYLPDYGSNQYYAIQLSSQDTGNYAECTYGSKTRRLSTAEWAYYGLLSPFLPHWYQGDECAGDINWTPAGGGTAKDLGVYDGRLNWSAANYNTNGIDAWKVGMISNLIAFKQSNGSIINEYPTDHRLTNMMDVPTTNNTIAAGGYQVPSYVRYNGGCSGTPTAILVACPTGWMSNTGAVAGESGTLTLSLSSALLNSMNMGAYSDFKVTDLVANTTTTMTPAQLASWSLGWSMTTFTMDPTGTATGLLPIVKKIVGNTVASGNTVQTPGSFTMPTFSTLYVGSTYSFMTPSLYDTTGAAITGANILSVVDNPSVAMIQTNGTLLAVGVGTANLHSRFGSIEGWSPITVAANSIISNARSSPYNFGTNFNCTGFSAVSTVSVFGTYGTNPQWVDCNANQYGYGTQDNCTMSLSYLPSAETVNAINYQFASTANGHSNYGQGNAIKCIGQTISLPNCPLAYISMIANCVNYTTPYQMTVGYQDGSSDVFSFQMPYSSVIGKYDTIGWSAPAYNRTSLDSWGGCDHCCVEAIPVYCPVENFYTNPNKNVASVTLPHDVNLYVLAMTLGRITNANSGQGSGSGQMPTAYHLDLYDQAVTMNLGNQIGAFQAISALQGLVNRDAPRLFVRYWSGGEDNTGEDTIWNDMWDKTYGCLGHPGFSTSSWNSAGLPDVAHALTTFAPYIKGVVLEDPNVPATSLAATTAAACMNAIPTETTWSVCSYMTAPISLGYLGLPVLLDLRNMFTPGESFIPQTGSPGITGTGSVKNDVYLWAKYNFLDGNYTQQSWGNCVFQGCDPTVLSYTMDACANTYGGYDLQTQLPNLDYAYSRRAFCFDLSVFGTTAPPDDPGQKAGTDLATFTNILTDCQSKNGANQMIRFCGYAPAHLKYTTSSNESTFREILVDLVSSCGGYVEYDSDSADSSIPYGFVSNGSFYKGFTPLLQEYPCYCPRWFQYIPQNKTALQSAGILDGSYNINPGNYVCMVDGDHNGAPSLVNDLACNDKWDDTGVHARGTFTMNWAINPNLMERAWPVFDWIYGTASNYDYFLSWKSGAGYLHNNALPGIYAGTWQEQCKNYFRFGNYSVTACLEDSGGAVPTTNELDSDSTFSYDGMGYTATTLGSNIYDAVPAQVMTGDLGLYSNQTRSQGLIIDNPTGVNFGLYNCNGWQPGDMYDFQIQYTNEGQNNHHHFLDCNTYFNLLNYAMSNYATKANYYHATWYSDDLPRIMVAGQKYTNMWVGVRNDGWDTWTPSNYTLAYCFTTHGSSSAPWSSATNVGAPGMPSSVAPSSSWSTADFSITAPTVNGVYDLHIDLKGPDGYFNINGVNGGSMDWVKTVIVATNAWDVDTDGDGVPDVVEQANGTAWWDPDSY